jgi:hypothetical protein
VQFSTMQLLGMRALGLKVHAHRQKRCRFPPSPPPPTQRRTWKRSGPQHKSAASFHKPLLGRTHRDPVCRPPYRKRWNWFVRCVNTRAHRRTFPVWWPSYQPPMLRRRP